VPRPPQRLTGKTLSLATPREGTRLELDTPAHLQVAIGRRTTELQIRAHQVGSGTVTGRVLADRDWVTVEPGRLEPGATEHVLTVRVHPDRMQRPHGSSVVTIVPSHGPRLSVTLDVGQRARPTARLLIIGAVAIALTAVVATALSHLPDALPHHERTLRVDPDPSTSLVYVGDHLVGPGSHTIHDRDLPEGPVELHVRLDGFTPYSKVVKLEDGKTVALSPRLELANPLAFEPTAGQQGAPVPADQVREILQDNHDRLAACFTADAEAEAESSPPDHVTLRAFVGFGGQVEGLQIGEPKKVSEALRGCIARTLRAQSFTLGEPADYWYFDATLRPKDEGRSTDP